MQTVNCVSHRLSDVCTHQAAPRRLFGSAKCILNYPSIDLRVPCGCKLQVKYEKVAQIIESK